MIAHKDVHLLSIRSKVQRIAGFFQITQSSVSKLSPINLLEGFGVSTGFFPQLLMMLIIDFNEIYSAWLP